MQEMIASNLFTLIAVVTFIVQTIQTYKKMQRLLSSQEESNREQRESYRDQQESYKAFVTALSNLTETYTRTQGEMLKTNTHAQEKLLERIERLEVKTQEHTSKIKEINRIIDLRYKGSYD